MNARCSSKGFGWSRSLAFVLLVAAFASPALAVNRRAFVTSVSGNGRLGDWPDAGLATGLDAGDAICRARAAGAAIPLPNAATYRAWLSSSTTDAYCHVQGLSGKKATGCGGAILPGGGPWYLSNGTGNFSGTLDQLTGPGRVLYRAILFDENFDELTSSDQDIWTGTLADGTATVNICLNWTSASASDVGTYGKGLHSARSWTYWSANFCDQNRRLLCLEPGASTVTTLGWTPGSLVFLSSETGGGDLHSWPGAGIAIGIAAADNVCRSLATAAHLPAPQSFVAWLSDDSHDASARLTSNGPYRRVDGYTIANSEADLEDGSVSNSIHVFENGAYQVDSPFSVFTASSGTGTRLPNTCSGWTENDFNLPQPRSGLSSAARNADWTNLSTSDCENPSHLYCFSNQITLFWDGFDLTGDVSRWSSSAP